MWTAYGWFIDDLDKQLVGEPRKSVEENGGLYTSELVAVMYLSFSMGGKRVKQVTMTWRETKIIVGKGFKSVLKDAQKYGGLHVCSRKLKRPSGE